MNKYHNLILIIKIIMVILILIIKIIMVIFSKQDRRAGMAINAVVHVITKAGYAYSN